MKLLEALKSGSIITVDNFNEVQDIYADDFIEQYNVTPTWLVDEYRFTKYNGHTIVYKLKPFAAANIAIVEKLPKSMGQDEAIAFICELKNLGMNIRLTMHELDKFDKLDTKQWKQVDTAKGDFVYSRSNNHSIEGKDNESLRTGLNRFNKNPDFHIEFLKPSKISDETIYEIHKLLDSYVEGKKASGNKTGFTFHLRKYVNNFKQWAKDFDEKRAIQLVRYQGRLVAFSISEYMNDWNVSLPDRKAVLQDIPKMQHAFRAINWNDINYWVTKLNHDHDIYFNFGSAGDSKDLYETKTRLHPHCIMKNYKLKHIADLHPDLLEIVRPSRSSSVVGLFYYSDN